MDQENAQESRLESDVVEDFDDWCLANGFEFIDLQDQPLNSNLGRQNELWLIASMLHLYGQQRLLTLFWLPITSTRRTCWA